MLVIKRSAISPISISISLFLGFRMIIACRWYDDAHVDEGVYPWNHMCIIISPILGFRLMSKESFCQNIEDCLSIRLIFCSKTRIWFCFKGPISISGSIFHLIPQTPLLQNELAHDGEGGIWVIRWIIDIDIDIWPDYQVECCKSSDSQVQDDDHMVPWALISNLMHTIWLLSILPKCCQISGKMINLGQLSISPHQVQGACDLQMMWGLLIIGLKLIICLLFGIILGYWLEFRFTSRKMFMLMPTLNANLLAWWCCTSTWISIIGLKVGYW